MNFWGFTIQVIGEILIALTVLRVHQQMLRERKIDKKVERDIRKEQVIGVAGIICIVIGYLMQIQ